MPMKKLISISLCLFWSLISGAQKPGEWTWMSGVNYLDNRGIYGAKGTASTSNVPPGDYEAIEWTDKQGNFWFYGGTTYNGYLDDLWKYDISLNLWTWVKGSGARAGKFPTYGTLGVPSSLNSPGMRTTSGSWTDNDGNLWLYGGIAAYDGAGGGMAYNDLWKYSIATNMWTWMKGDTNSLVFYGKKNVEIANRTPPYLMEMGLSWSDKNNNLWMMDDKGCLWKYRIATNNWVWINGDSNGVANYGTKGIPSASTTPGRTFFAYSRWKDYNDDLWYLYSGESFTKSVLFKYTIASNMWTWVWGDTTSKDELDNCKYGDTLCDYTFDAKSKENVIPFARGESRSCWVDYCNNLWMMGGGAYTHLKTKFESLNDMVFFDTQINKWVWVGNDTVENYTGNYGTIGVANPTNKPPSRTGAIPFKDKAGNLWLYGGLYYVDRDMRYFGDLWRYTMNKGCPPCINPSGYKNVGITDFNVEQIKITIAPNPFYDYCNISFDQFYSHLDLLIYDVLGQKIMELNNISGDSYKLSRNNLNAGVYLLRIAYQGKIISTQKIMLQ